MPDDLHINEELGVVEIRSHDNVTQEDIEESVEKLREILDSRGIASVLVDTREQTSMPDITGIFEIFSKFPRKIHVALWVREGQKTDSDIQFVETVSQNWGVIFKRFFDRESALRWLQSEA